jgi:hypothetical protein
MLRDHAAFEADGRFTEPVIFRTKVVKPPVAFGTKTAAIPVIDSRELRQPSHKTTAKMMQKPFTRQARSPTTGAYLANVEVVACAFGAESDALEKALLEVVPAGEEAELVFILKRYS